MKIGLFTSYLRTYETQRFVESAQELGHQLEIIPLQSLIINISRDGKLDLKLGENIAQYHSENIEENLNLTIVEKENDFTKYDAIIERGGNRTGEPERTKLKILIYKYYKDLGKPVLNGFSQTKKADNKLWQHFLFAENAIPVVPTMFVASKENLSDATKNLTFPVFAKAERGSHGVNTAAPKNFDELYDFYNKVKNPAYLLIQKKLGTNWDVRILVLGSKVLGGMKRTAAEGSHVSNFSAGGSIEMVELSKEEKELAISAAKSLSAEYGGADIMRDTEGNLYLLEFNRNASFKGFEEATKIDVPKEIFDYLSAQIEKNNIPNSW